MKQQIITMKFSDIFFITSVAILIFGANSVHGSKAEKQLIQHLLNDMEPGERPVENHKDNVSVTVGLTIMRVDDVVDDLHHVELTAWLTLKWVAYNLQWKPSEYDDITTIRLHPSKIWVPDIYSYSSIAESIDRFHPTLVVVHDNGTIAYIPPGQMTNPCSLLSDSSYPFEKLKCELKLGSWVYNGEQLDLQLDPAGTDLQAMVENPEWKILGCPAKRTVNYYPCCAEPYVDVRFTLTLQRRGEAILDEAKSFSFFALGLLFMSCLLGPRSDAKLLLALVSMILCIHFSNRFDSKLGTAEPPELAKYFIKLSYLGFFILFTNLLVYYFYPKVGSLPDRVKKVVDKFSQFALPTSREGVATTSLPPALHNYNDLQELTLSETQTNKQLSQELGDWQILSLLVDKFCFVFWTIVLVLFDLSAFPKYDV